MYGSIHTHFESQYDTGNDKKEMLKNFIKAGAKKVAVTEHGVFSSYEDLKEIVSSMKEEAEKDNNTLDFDIIPGVEGYFEDEANHIILIAKDYEGYQSLCKIISESNKNIQKGKPIITLDNLKENVSKGHLVCTSACINGIFGSKLGSEEYFLNQKIKQLDEEIEKSSYRKYVNIISKYEDTKKQEKIIRPTKSEINATQRLVKKTGETNLLEDIADRIIEADKLQEWLVQNLSVYNKATEILKQKINNSKLSFKAIYSKKQTKLEKYEETLKEIESAKLSGETEQDLYLTFSSLISIFGEDDFYFELQNHDLPAEEIAYNNIISFAYRVGHPKFIASNDIHIGAQKTDKEYEDYRLRRNVMKFTRFNSYQEESEDDKEYTIKTDDELKRELSKIIKDAQTPFETISANEIINQAIINIQNVLEECHIEFPKNVNHYPKFCDDENAEFERKVREGILQKFPNGFPKGREEEYEQRINYEIGIIKQMGYAGYHLIVADYLQYARLLGYLPTQEEIDNAPTSIEELDAYITKKGYPRIGYPIGPGRGCSKKGTIIYTNNGSKSIEMIEPGDMVYDYTGKLCPVLKRWEYPVKEEMLNITIWNGGKLCYTKDHKFYSASSITETNKMKLAQGSRYKDTKPETPFEWKMAQDLKQGDWVAIPRIKLPLENKSIVFDLAKYANKKYKILDNTLHCINTDELIKNNINISKIAKELGMSKTTVNLFFHNSTKTKKCSAEKIEKYLNAKGFSVNEWRNMEKTITIPRYIPLTPELSYLIGYYIADGWYHNDSINFAYNNKTEIEYAEKIIKNIITVLGPDVIIKDYKNTSELCNSIKVLCSPFAKLIKEIVPGKAQTKQIPACIYNTTENHIKSLLVGLFDGDGSYCEKTRAKYSTCNRALAHEIKRLLIHFGIAACVRKYERKNPKWNDEWTVSLSTCKDATLIFPKLSKSTRTSKNNISYTDDNFIYMRIKDISAESYEGIVYDLAVKTDNEPSYCTDTCAVHNSAVGSICCYALGITDIDPIPYDLLFERFLNIERASMPDIDSDFKMNIRNKAVEYCGAKYGKDCICQIMTKSYGATKGNIRLAARYLGTKEYEEIYGDLDLYMDEISLDLDSDLDISEEEKSESVDNTPKIEKANPKLKEYLKDWYNRADKLAKAYDELGGELPDLESLTENERETVKLANILEGVFTNYGEHAAGTIISGDDLREIIPLRWNDKKKAMETQCTMAQAEAKGLLKMDFLGLKNLDIITDVLRNPTKTKELARFLKIDENSSKYIDYMDGNLQDYKKRDDYLNDPTIYRDIFSTGLTQGVFQFASIGMKKMLIDFQPENFNDIILLVAAYRPGPIDYIPEIIASKWREKYKDNFTAYKEKIQELFPFSKEEYISKKEKGLAYFYDEHGNVLKEVPHSITLKNETLQKILSTTYGCPIYQEQIMRIFQDMAGYSLGGADIVRRYMSKKKRDKLAKEKEAFIYGDEKRNIPGAVKLHGISIKEAEDLFEQMMPFAEYGFNKSHATAYAMVAAFTAYLKKYHTADFFRSCLNWTGALKEIPDYVNELSAFGITLKPPTMLDSKNAFSVEDEGKTIRFGLQYIKGFSEQNIHRYTTMQDFIERNPGISLSLVEKYAKLGMFEECWRTDKKTNRVKGNRHECLRWLNENGKNLERYLELLEKTTNLSDSLEQLNLQLEQCEDEDKIIELQKEIKSQTASFKKSTEQRKEVGELLTTNLNNDKTRRVGYETPEEILENRKWEIEMLSIPFDIKYSLQRVRNSENKKTFDDLSVPIDSDIKTIKVPAVVLSVSEEKQVKKSGKTYYEVSLMDRNQNIITRRFDMPPKVLDGEFTIFTNNYRYYTCNYKDYKPISIQNNQKRYFSPRTDKEVILKAIEEKGVIEKIPTTCGRSTPIVVKTIEPEQELE